MKNYKIKSIYNKSRIISVINYSIRIQILCVLYAVHNHLQGKDIIILIFHQFLADNFEQAMQILKIEIELLRSYLHNHQYRIG